MFCDVVFFFFFKQKTAYEMRISDWSSDVCSSDLGGETDGGVFEVDRRDPFAARLDHVFRSVGDLHVAVGIECGDVAGGEPAVVVEHLAALALEIDRKSVV